MSARCYDGPQTCKWKYSNADQFSDLTSEVTDLNEDQQNYSEEAGVKQRMRQLLEKEFHVDVIFYPRDKSNASISAHKAILAVGSPLFEKMLYSENRTTATEGTKMEIYISNIPFLAFSSIVRYLYTDEIFFESDSMVQEILNGAQQFEIQSLIDRCNTYFEEQEITDENVCLKLRLSHTNKVDALKERCLEYIQKNTYHILRSPGFGDCSPDTIHRICKLQSLNLRSEVELIDAAVAWLYNQPPAQKKQSTDSLLKSFRFLTLTVNEMTDILKKYPGLIKPADGLQIILYLTHPPKTPNSVALPSWCNKSTSTRCCFEEITRRNADSLKGADGVTESITFPLKHSHGQNATQVTSLVKMNCLRGSHQLFSIKLSFQPPVSHKSSIGSLSITIRVSPSGFRCQERIEIMNSLDVRVPFKKRILARRGDIVDIEVDARNIVLYTFYSFNEAASQPRNPHFRCTVRSIPQTDRMFCISEIEYGELVQNSKTNRRY